MLLTVIIPTYNEIKQISLLLNHLKNANQNNLEIIVCDGGSTDGTQEVVEKSGIKLLHSPLKGRAKQMNYASQQSNGEVLYFVHADTIPPISFIDDILTSIKEGFPIGCYRFKFNSNKKILKVNSYFTRFDRLMCRGGDQSLYITKSVFEELNGYCKNHKIMEDYDIIIRARKKYSFKIIPKDVIVSARKYDQNSYLKVNITNFLVFMMYYAKVDQDKIIRFYRAMLNHKKSKLKY
jgi:rSAM/selenodomain-associated transferase 2